MYMSRITSRAAALTKRELHDALRSWYAESTERTIGDPGKSKGRPWILIADGDRCYHLNADTTRQAVWAYLHSVEKYGEDLAWVIRQTGPGKQTKVVFGPHQLAEHEFQLFAYKT